jgi:hypothetical protein
VFVFFFWYGRCQLFALPAVNVIRYPSKEHDMYWRWRSIPELKDLPEPQRKALWRKAINDPFRVTDVWLFLLLVGVLGALFAIALWLSTRPAWSIVLAFFVLAFLVDRLVNVVLVIRFRPVVRRLRTGQ